METLRYARIRFSDPDEVLVLPVSAESLLVVHGGLQSTRRAWSYSDYHRFVTSGRIVNGP